MQTPTIDQLFSYTTGGSYLEEPFTFFVGNDGPADSFTGCSIVGGIYLAGVLKLDMGSASTGFATITQPNTVNIAVPAANMAALAVGVYQVHLWLVTAGGQTQDLVGYSLEIKRP